MKHYIIFVIIFFLFQSCNAQNYKVKQTEINKDSVEIIDPIIKLPYEIKNINQVIILPDILGGEDVKGYVYIRLTINNNSEILETSIMKLFLKNQIDGKIIEYNVTQGKIPVNLNKHVVFFDEYCKKKLIIEKKYNPKSKNLMQIRLKIGHVSSGVLPQTP